jgi:outer membrane lipoprotein carrier protein
MKTFFSTFFSATLLFAATTASAQTAQDDLAHFLNDTKTAQMNFIQTTFNKAGKPTQNAEGALLISRPNHFRWETTMPYPQLIVGTGEKVWFYDPDLNQVVVRGSDEALGGTPAALLAGAVDVEKAFTVTPDGKDASGTQWVKAIPKDKEAGFQQIRLGFRNAKLAYLELFDAFDQKIVTRFTRVEENLALDPQLFQFTPPEGADVIN